MAFKSIKKFVLNADTLTFAIIPPGVATGFLNADSPLFLTISGPCRSDADYPDFSFKRKLLAT